MKNDQPDSGLPNQIQITVNVQAVMLNETESLRLKPIPNAEHWDPRWRPNSRESRLTQRPNFWPWDWTRSKFWLQDRGWDQDFAIKAADIQSGLDTLASLHLRRVTCDRGNQRSATFSRLLTLVCQSQLQLTQLHNYCPNIITRVTDKPQLKSGCGHWTHLMSAEDKCIMFFTDSSFLLRPITVSSTEWLCSTIKFNHWLKVPKGFGFIVSYLFALC